MAVRSAASCGGFHGRLVLRIVILVGYSQTGAVRNRLFRMSWLRITLASLPPRLHHDESSILSTVCNDLDHARRFNAFALPSHTTNTFLIYARLREGPSVFPSVEIPLHLILLPPRRRTKAV